MRCACRERHTCRAAEAADNLLLLDREDLLVLALVLALVLVLLLPLVFLLLPLVLLLTSLNPLTDDPSLSRTRICVLPVACKESSSEEHNGMGFSWGTSAYRSAWGGSRTDTGVPRAACTPSSSEVATVQSRRISACDPRDRELRLLRLLSTDLGVPAEEVSSCRTGTGCGAEGCLSPLRRRGTSLSGTTEGVPAGGVAAGAAVSGAAGSGVGTAAAGCTTGSAGGGTGSAAAVGATGRGSTGAGVGAACIAAPVGGTVSSRAAGGKATSFPAHFPGTNAWSGSTSESLGESGRVTGMSLRRAAKKASNSAHTLEGLRARCSPGGALREGEYWKNL